MYPGRIASVVAIPAASYGSMSAVIRTVFRLLALVNPSMPFCGIVYASLTSSYASHPAFIHSFKYPPFMASVVAIPEASAVPNFTSLIKASRILAAFLRPFVPSGITL